ncbi:MAG: hypothetical protein WKF73_09890 [Nocardioidaceae bacterium]
MPTANLESAAEIARRRRVVGGSRCSAQASSAFPSRPGPDRRSFTLTAAVAATWTAGGLLSGPLHLGWIQSRDQRQRRPVIIPVATGIGAFGCFYLSALVASTIPTSSGHSPTSSRSPRKAARR